MAAKLTRLTHKIAIQLHLVAENCTICSSRSRRPVRKLMDTPSYLFVGDEILVVGLGYKNRCCLPTLTMYTYVTVHANQMQMSIKFSSTRSVTHTY
jgi:hypothetical protein